MLSAFGVVWVATLIGTLLADTVPVRTYDVDWDLYENEDTQPVSWGPAVDPDAVTLYRLRVVHA